MLLKSQGLVWTGNRSGGENISLNVRNSTTYLILDLNPRIIDELRPLVFILRYAMPNHRTRSSRGKERKKKQVSLKAKNRVLLRPLRNTAAGQTREVVVTQLTG
jgi:hypothetical protein